MPGTVTLVKLGGSLITDKNAPGTARPELIRQLAEQLARAHRCGHRLVVGHGSGSFGHPEARRAGLTGSGADAPRVAVPAGTGAAAPVDAAPRAGRDAGRLRTAQAVPVRAAGARGEQGDEAPFPPAVARVQARAAELHRLVLDALLAAGAAPFSVPPSAVAVARDGRIEHFHAETVRLALGRDFIPVLYGDVVLDRVRGASICSTESALGAVADSLRAVGWRIDRCLWLGATPGVIGPDGRPLERISVDQGQVLRSAAGGAEAPDVTGGMRHRVDAALAFARAGIPSWIGDGSSPDVLERLLADAEVPGTLVAP